MVKMIIYYTLKNKNNNKKVYKKLNSWRTFGKECKTAGQRKNWIIKQKQNKLKNFIETEILVNFIIIIKIVNSYIRNKI